MRAHVTPAMQILTLGSLSAAQMSCVLSSSSGLGIGSSAALWAQRLNARGSRLVEQRSSSSVILCSRFASAPPAVV